MLLSMIVLHRELYVCEWVCVHVCSFGAVLLISYELINICTLLSPRRSLSLFFCSPTLSSLTLPLPLIIL